jgi:DNA-binding beta-propeller fold protein YncE
LQLSVTKMNKHLALLILTGTLALLAAPDQAMTQGEAPALKLEAKIPIGNVSGRIDHMAVDLTHQRLFVAELGNDTVGIVDLNGRKVVRTLDGLKEPQGVGYLPATDTLYVAGRIMRRRDGSISEATRTTSGSISRPIELSSDTAAAASR